MTRAVVAMLLLTLAACACATDAELRVAIASANTVGQVLQQVDSELAAQQKLDRAAANAAHPNAVEPGDALAYGAQLADDNARADALAAAWHLHGLMRVALTIWQNSSDVSAPTPQWQQAAECAAVALKRLGALMSPQWREMLGVVAAPLEAAHLARDDPCEAAP
jgi:hypothetical protein